MRQAWRQGAREGDFLSDQAKRFDGYVGMFDSGVGGMSVLKRAVDIMPNEDYLFFGDSANNPYGEKGAEWIVARSRTIVDRMLGLGCKAIVIACNTATSAAVETLRAEHPDIPIVGVEPALKPAAVEGEVDGQPWKNCILVMATPVTLKLDKFRALYKKWGHDSEVHIVPCVGLANRIEQGNFEAPDMYRLLEGLIGEYAGRVDSVVLGCTHYPFVKKQILDVLGSDVAVYDGGPGTARQLRRLLERDGLRSSNPGKGHVVLRSSINTPEMMERYQWLYRQPL